jgi:PHD/YefM family antitoxin component YafN of YafNO toxin-antitoxin module
MDPDEVPHLLPDGERVWVVSTSEASKNLSNLLNLFRSGQTEPLVFGDAGQPEAVVVPWDTWRRLDALAADEHGFDHAYETARQRLDDPGPSIPLEEAAAQIGWDLDEPLDDSGLSRR